MKDKLGREFAVGDTVALVAFGTIDSHPSAKLVLAEVRAVATFAIQVELDGRLKGTDKRATKVFTSADELVICERAYDAAR